MLKPAILMLALLAPALAAAQAPHPADPVAAAERAFAADGKAMGVKPSFVKWSTPDAMLILAEPVNVHAYFAGRPDPAPGAPPLLWWPAWVGIAKSGDLGISTGPVEVNGQRASHYFTVWKRQSDGGWKWVYDGGVGADGSKEAGPEAPVAHLPVSTFGSASPAAAMAEVRAAETAFSAAAAQDQAAAHLAVLADDGRLYVEPLPPAKGRTDFAAALKGYPAAMQLGPPLGGEASAAGDLAYTYGKANAGHYVHIWQKRAASGAGAWKLVFSQVLPPPPPAAR